MKRKPEAKNDILTLKQLFKMAKIPYNLSESSYYTPSFQCNPSYICNNGWMAPRQLDSKTDILRPKMTEVSDQLGPKKKFFDFFFGPKSIEMIF